MKSGVVSDLLQAFVSSNILPNISIDSVSYSLQIHGYSTAITKKRNQFDLRSIEQYAISHQYLMLVLNMTNVLYQSRKHLIGIVPLSQGDEVHMHIVEGSHPENKTIPLNKKKIGWCSGDSSCFVDRVVVFLPGKRIIKALQKRINESTTDHLYLHSAANATQLKESLERITIMIKPI
jgi:hypothetical protein